MRKSILILVIVGAIVVGSVLTPQNAVADHDADFAILQGAFGTLLNAVINGFTAVSGGFGTLGETIDANTAAIDAIGPHTTDTNAGTICRTGQILDGEGICIPIPAGVPIGTVLAWTGLVLPKPDFNILPPGFLIADGSSLLRTDFPALFNVIKTTYGEGADRLRLTTFSLPDLRDTFIRGTTVNLGVAGGTAIDDPEPTATDTLSHSHSVNPPATTSGPASSSVIATISLGPPITAASKFHTHSTNIGSITSSTVSITHSVDIGPTGNEPPFLSLVMIIRAE